MMMRTDAVETFLMMHDNVKFCKLVILLANIVFKYQCPVIIQLILMYINPVYIYSKLLRSVAMILYSSLTRHNFSMW